MGQTPFIAHAPSQMQGPVDLGIDAEDQFGPMLVAGFVFHAKRRVPLPYGVGEGLSCDVHLVVGIGIAQSDIDAVARVLLSCQIYVGTNAEVGCLGLVGDACHFIVLMVSTSVAHLNDREILVAKVQTQGCLILSVVAQQQLGGSYQVGRHGEAVEQGHRVGLYLDLSLRTCWAQRQKADEA